jgi:voltage-gated sodium channel
MTLLQQIVHSKAFNRFIITVIAIAAVLVGLETSADIRAEYGKWLHVFDVVILTIFTIEILLKMGAHGKRPWDYFKDPWNVFDFSIVVVCFMPMDGQFAAVLRLVRILRVLRLVSAVPRLQLLVGALLKSIPSMGYVGILLLILFYIYGVMGTFLFGKHDPVHFGTLGASMLALFRTVTMEDWTDLMYTQMYGAGYVEGLENPVFMAPHGYLAIAYFVSFILLGTMIMLNLFIGVIMRSMNEVELEAELAMRAKHRATLGYVTVADEIRKLEHQIDGLKESLHTILHRVENENKADLAVRPISTETDLAMK